MRNTFNKSERLNSKLLIEKLFSSGASFFVHPFRVTYVVSVRDDGPPVKVMISASKRNYKLAVNRNRIKRLIREAYRTNKYIIRDYFDDESDKQLLISIVYAAKTIVPYSEIERKLILILQSLIKKNEQNNR